MVDDKMKPVYIFLILAVIAVGAYFIGANNATGFASLTLADSENQTQITTETSTDAPGNVQSIYEKTEFERFSELISREKLVEEQRRPNRDTYNVFPEVFEDLPAIPDDFGTMVYLFEVGAWRNLDYFTEGYYMQPEFYKARGDFDKICLRMWTDPRVGSHTLEGWGAYPGDLFIDTYRGATFKVKTFWNVPCGVEQYQGFNLAYYYPPNSQDEAEETYNSQDPAVVKNYFDVKIIDNEFLLGPTYPKFLVNPPYAKPVEAKITVKENAVPGTYVIGIDTTKVSDEQHDAWLIKYKAAYNDAAGGSMGLNRPHWRITITVN